MALEQEMETYRRELPGLAAEEGRFALIKGDQLVDIYDTYGDAIKAGYDRFTLDPFMVKEIHAIEPVHYFTRDLHARCR